MDSSFLESLPEAHPIDTEIVLKEFFAAASKAVTYWDIVLAAGVAANQMEGLEA